MKESDRENLASSSGLEPYADGGNTVGVGLAPSSFTSVASFSVTGANEVTIPAASVDPNMDGADFFRVKN